MSLQVPSLRKQIQIPTPGLSGCVSLEGSQILSLWLQPVLSRGVDGKRLFLWEAQCLALCHAFQRRKLRLEKVKKKKTLLHILGLGGHIFGKHQLFHSPDLSFLIF